MNFVFENIKTYENFIDCDDINPSGIKRFTPSPAVTTLLRYKQMQDKFVNFDVQKLNVSHSPAAFSNYIIASGVNHSNEDWTGPTEKFKIGFDERTPERKILFSYLNHQYLADLRSGKAMLLLDQTHESYQAEWLNNWFHCSCAEFDINPKQIIYITGNLDVVRQYKEWADKNEIADRICMIPFAHFERSIYDTAINRVRIDNLPPLPNFEDHITYKTANLDKIKDYNFLQKRTRAHRMWFFKEIFQAGLLESGINSMNTFSLEHTYYMNRKMDESDYNEVMKHLPMLPPGIPYTQEELDHFSAQDSGKYIMEFNPDIVLDTWVSVISEASFGENTCFISEKSFKPIACRHPFIIAGNKLSLHYLREMGYKTFSPFIDETYDTLECWERMVAIIESLKKIQQIPKEQKLDWFRGMQETLDHNYQVLKNNSVNNISASVLTIDSYFKGNHVQ